MDRNVRTVREQDGNGKKYRLRSQSLDDLEIARAMSQDSHRCGNNAAKQQVRDQSITKLRKDAPEESASADRVDGSKTKDGTGTCCITCTKEYKSSKPRDHINDSFLSPHLTET